MLRPVVSMLSIDYLDSTYASSDSIARAIKYFSIVS